MKLSLEIETYDRSLAFDLAGEGNSLKSGTIVSIPGGARLEYQGILVRKAVGIPEVLKFVVDASINIELALLAAWLYDKVKDKKVERIVVNRKMLTEITEHGILHILEEEFRRISSSNDE